ncbi:hypothetical protein VTG60DRAFT_1974 [Thermothelomyces hinnuleus]
MVAALACMIAGHIRNTGCRPQPGRTGKNGTTWSETELHCLFFFLFCFYGLLHSPQHGFILRTLPRKRRRTAGLRVLANSTRVPDVQIINLRASRSIPCLQAVCQNYRATLYWTPDSVVGAAWSFTQCSQRDDSATSEGCGRISCFPTHSLYRHHRTLIQPRCLYILAPCIKVSIH